MTDEKPVKVVGDLMVVALIAAASGALVSGLVVYLLCAGGML